MSFTTQDINIFMSSLPGHSLTHRFNIHLFLVIKEINLQGGWQPSTAADKARLSLGTLQPLLPYQGLCRNYLHISHIDCLRKDRDLAVPP